MLNFLIPCISLISVFWISCAVVYLMIKSQLAPIVRSIRRLERQNGGRNAEDFVVQEQPRPRPIAPRYVTVERGWK